MASEQTRRENVTGERKIEVEKDKVPKMTTHFESLAEKTKDEPLHGERVHHHVETTAAPVKVTAAVVTEQKQPQHQKTPGGAGPGHSAPSLEEISKLRGTAQHNSAEAIRAAEERYQKAKDRTPTETHHQQPDTHQPPKGYTTAAMEKSLQAKDYAAQKAMEAKDALAAKGQTAAQLAAEKAKLAKETAADASKVGAEYVGEKAAAAKDVTVESGKGAVGYAKVAAGYVGEKAAAAKDVTVESGKGAAGYAGKVASGVKDQAVVAGWGATHYTMEKVAEATKTVAGVTSSVAGYTKDKVAGAGQTVGGYAAEKLAAAKDAVVATEEKAADYAARKKAEAQKDLEVKKLAHERGLGGEGESLVSKEQTEAGEQWEMPSEKFEEEEYFQGGAGGYEQKPKQASTGTGTVFQAIGETIAEIGQTTKDLLIGQRPVEEKDEVKEKECPYTGGAAGGRN